MFLTYSILLILACDDTLFFLLSMSVIFLLLFSIFWVIGEPAYCRTDMHYTGEDCTALHCTDR